MRKILFYLFAILCISVNAQIQPQIKITSPNNSISVTKSGQSFSLTTNGVTDTVISTSGATITAQAKRNYIRMPLTITAGTLTVNDIPTPSNGDFYSVTAWGGTGIPVIVGGTTFTMQSGSMLQITRYRRAGTWLTTVLSPTNTGVNTGDQTITAGSNISTTTSGTNYTVSTTQSPTFSGTVTTGVLNESEATSAASSSTVDLNAVNGNLVHITGTTTINSFGTAPAGAERTLVFDGSLTLTYNATSMILPTLANLQTYAGDCAIVRSEGSGNWRFISYNQVAQSTGTWTPSWTGFSANPTVGVAKYVISGNVCTVWLYAPAGTSNGTTLTVTLPFAAIDGNLRQVVGAINNGGNALGLVTTTAGSNVLTCYVVNSLTAAAGAWTASSTKTVFLCGFSYLIN